MATGKLNRWLTPDGIVLLTGWARSGLTLKQIAHNCGCSLSTLCKWQQEHSEISEAIKKGKEVVDYQVENALLKRALGYTYKEVTVETSDEGVKRKVATKEMAPDVTAQIYWLKNRKSAVWRDKPANEAENDELLALRQLLGGITSAF